jgi:hypothetical protein
MYEQSGAATRTQIVRILLLFSFFFSLFVAIPPDLTASTVALIVYHRVEFVV